MTLPPMPSLTSGPLFDAIAPVVVSCLAREISWDQFMKYPPQVQADLSSVSAKRLQAMFGALSQWHQGQADQYAAAQAAVASWWESSCTELWKHLDASAESRRSQSSEHLAAIREFLDMSPRQRQLHLDHMNLFPPDIPAEKPGNKVTADDQLAAIATGLGVNSHASQPSP